MITTRLFYSKTGNTTQILPALNLAGADKHFNCPKKKQKKNKKNKTKKKLMAYNVSKPGKCF